MKPGASQLPRPLVAARMRRALDDGCLLVVAPAGYGKTLAIQQAVEEHGGAAVWHACRDRDADGGRLVVSILEAVRRTVPGAADVLLDRLRGAGGGGGGRAPAPPRPPARAPAAEARQAHGRRAGDRAGRARPGLHR